MALKGPSFGALMNKRRIFVNDVAMRDGLQIESVFVPTEDKIRMVNALSQTGLSKIEVTSPGAEVILFAPDQPGFYQVQVNTSRGIVYGLDVQTIL